MKHGLTQKHLMIIQEVFTHYHAISQVILFGSRAKGTFKATSDIDIALRGEIDIKLIARIKAEYEDSSLPFFVDIINYAKADEALRREIDTHGIVIYKRDISPMAHNMACCSSVPVSCHSECSKESHVGKETRNTNKGDVSHTPNITKDSYNLYILNNKNDSKDNQ